MRHLSTEEKQIIATTLVSHLSQNVTQVYLAAFSNYAEVPIDKFWFQCGSRVLSLDIITGNRYVHLKDVSPLKRLQRVFGNPASGLRI